MNTPVDELDPQADGSAAADAPAAGHDDPPPDAGDAAADADEDAAWAEVIAEAEGEPLEAGDRDAPPASEGSDETPGPPLDDGAPDIWADAPEDLRAAFAAERQRADQAEHARRSAEGRLNTAMHRLSRVTGTQQQRPRAGSQPTPTDSDGATDALAALREDYPEIAGPVAAVIEGLQAEVRTLREQTDTLGEERSLAAAEAAETELREVHPDFEAVTGTDDFETWLQSQSRVVQAVALENAEAIVSADDAAFVLDKYKAERGIATSSGNGQGQRSTPASLREIRLRSNRGNPKPSNGAVTRERGAEEASSEDRLWAHLERQEEKKLAAAARA